MIATVTEKLENNSRHWSSETASYVENLIEEIIQSANNDNIDVTRSRVVEQEVLNILDES